MFGHTWVNDGLPSSDGTQHRHCDNCGKKVVTNISKKVDVASMRYKVLLFDETIALVRDREMAIRIADHLPQDTDSYKAVVDSQTNSVVWEWCY